MALIRPTYEHREAVQAIYGLYGKQDFLQSEVKHVASKRVFKNLCDYKFIKKDGLHQIVTPHSDPTNKRKHIRFVNIWRLNLNDGLVENYVSERRMAMDKAFEEYKDVV